MLASFGGKEDSEPVWGGKESGREGLRNLHPRQSHHSASIQIMIDRVIDLRDVTSFRFYL